MKQIITQKILDFPQTSELLKILNIENESAMNT